MSKNIPSQRQKNSNSANQKISDGVKTALIGLVGTAVIAIATFLAARIPTQISISATQTAEARATQAKMTDIPNYAQILTESPTPATPSIVWQKNPILPSINYLPGFINKVSSSQDKNDISISEDQILLIFGQKVDIPEIGAIGSDGGCFVIAAKGPLINIHIVSLTLGNVEIFDVKKDIADPITWAAWRVYLSKLYNPECGQAQILIGETDIKGNIIWVHNPKLPDIHSYPGMKTIVSSESINEDKDNVSIKVNIDEILLINGGDGGGGIFPDIGVVGGSHTCSLVVTRGPYEIIAKINKHTIIEIFKVETNSNSLVWAAWKHIQMQQIGCLYIEDWIGR